MDSLVDRLEKLIDKLLDNNSKQQEIITEQIKLLTDLIEEYEKTKKRSGRR